jgi:hypothetical protein
MPKSRFFKRWAQAVVSPVFPWFSQSRRTRRPRTETSLRVTSIAQPWGLGIDESPHRETGLSVVIDHLNPGRGRHQMTISASRQLKESAGIRPVGEAAEKPRSPATRALTSCSENRHSC